MTNEQELGERFVREALSNSRRQRKTMSDVDFEWPDSRGLVARFAASLHALGMPEEQEIDLLRHCIAGGLSGYRKARNDGLFDADRLAAFVDGVSERCADQARRAMLAKALSERQRRILAERLLRSEHRAG